MCNASFSSLHVNLNPATLIDVFKTRQSNFLMNLRSISHSSLRCLPHDASRGRNKLTFGRQNALCIIHTRFIEGRFSQYPPLSLSLTLLFDASNFLICWRRLFKGFCLGKSFEIERHLQNSLSSHSSVKSFSFIGERENDFPSVHIFWCRAH